MQSALWKVIFLFLWKLEIVWNLSTIATLKRNIIIVATEAKLKSSFCIQYLFFNLKGGKKKSFAHTKRNTKELSRLFLDNDILNTFSSFQVGISGAEYIRKRKEKSTAILVAIILVFLICHIHRLAFRIYEMALPEKALFEHYKYCNSLGRYHVPVAIYFLTHTHHLFLVINSSINFVIYCFMGRQFRKKLKKIVKNLWKSVKNLKHHLRHQSNQWVYFCQSIKHIYVLYKITCVICTLLLRHFVAFSFLDIKAGPLA